MSVHRVRRLLALLGSAAGLLLVPAAPAHGHAVLDRSVPADGAVLQQAPAELRLLFTESVVRDATRIDVVDAAGRHHAPTALRLERPGPGGAGEAREAGEAGEDDTEAPVSLVAALPALPKGAYRVSWETLSSDDLHRTAGVLVLGVDRPVTRVAAVEPRPRADEASLRWLVFLGLSLALGGGLCERLLRRQGSPAAATAAARCSRWAVLGAGAALTVAPALLVRQLSAAGWAGRELLLGAYGRHWLLREAGLALLLAAALRTRRGRGSAALWVSGALAAAWGSALLGHAGAAPGPALTRVAADAAHLTAAALWAGGVLVLALVAVPRLRGTAAEAGAARAALRAFGLPAAACVGVMAVTGVYLASGLVGSVDAALLTVYGRTLLLKLAVVALAGGLGLASTLRLHRRPGWPAPRRAVAAEAAAAAVVLLLAAVLTSGAPALDPSLVRRPAPPTVPVVTGQAGDLQETLAIRPNRPGPNVVLVGVHDTRRPAPAPVRSVDVTVLLADGFAAPPVVAEPLADGQWSAQLRLADAGPVRVLVTAHRPGLPDSTRAYAWDVSPADVPARDVAVSDAPLEGPLRALAAGLALLIAATGLVRLRRRRLPAGPQAAAALADAPVPQEALVP